MPLPRQFTQLVNGSECIGDSLHNKINPNFDNLDTATQQLSTNLQTLSSFTYTLSSNTVSSILNLDNNNTTTLSLLTSLSSYTIPRESKAWVKFDGTAFNGLSATVFSSFNVLSVERFNTGSYRVYFSAWFPFENYVVTATPGTSGIYVYTLNSTLSTFELYSRTITVPSSAEDAIISTVIHGV
jgi:hypothetical protein